MKVSSRSAYAIKALTDLALDPRPSGVPMPELAEKYNISDSTMELVFFKLRRLGVVQGRRGRAGGYLLNRDPGDLRLGEVIAEVEEWLPRADMGTQISCRHDPGTRIWYGLADKVRNHLDSVTLADLLADMAASRCFMSTSPEG